MIVNYDCTVTLSCWIIKRLRDTSLMENMLNEPPSSKWLSVPLIATVTRLLCRELTLQNDYLRQENLILKSKIKIRISFTDDERRTIG